MSTERFDERGKLIIPRVNRSELGKPHKEEIVFSEVYCSKGHSIIDSENKIGGYPGIKMGFRRPNGESGMLAVISVLGRYDKSLLEGNLMEGEILEFFAPNVKHLFQF